MPLHPPVITATLSFNSIFRLPVAPRLAGYRTAIDRVVAGL
jgi:hypothetical protein